MLRAVSSVLGFGLLIMTFACGGGTQAPRAASDESEAAGAKKSHDDPSWYDDSSHTEAADEAATSQSKPSSSAATSKKKSKPNEATVAEPEFKEGMSVNDAINAVPQGYERVNMDQEALDRPLLDPEFYKPCKLAHTQHFEIRFAVWEGKAVGVDVKTTPNNKTAETCLRELIARNVWRDKVKSLNISTVQF